MLFIDLWSAISLILGLSSRLWHYVRPFFICLKVCFMELLEALTTRQSCARLIGPAPTEAQLEQIYAAAFRAPDHARLRPWRFLSIADEGLNALGELFVLAGERAGELSDAKRAKLASMPLRAPMVLVAYAKVQEHAKVPRNEQLMSTAAAMQNILLAAYGLGLGAMWRTGDLATNQTVKQGLGLAKEDELMGFIYLGQPDSEAKPIARMDKHDYVTQWPVK